MDRRRLIAAGITLASVAGAASVSTGALAAPSAQMNPVDVLVASEEIKKLKARYFRFVDTKQWDALTECFAPDATLWYPEYYKAPNPLAESLKIIRESLPPGALSVHQGYLPEIDITSPTTATGIWAMHDHLWLQGPDNIVHVSELIGAGHYHETYVKLGGKWVIKTLKLTRTRSVTTSLPKVIPDA